MDDVFFSALPAQGSFVLDDSSLALPAEPTPMSSTGLDSNKRSLRVQQQVQLTLKRRTRTSNGSFHLQKTTAKSFDGLDGFLSNKRANGFSDTSLPNRYMQTTSRRQDVSPPPSPETPHPRFYRYGMQAVPAAGPSHTAGTLPYHSSVSNSQRGFTFSETPRSMQSLFRHTPGTQSMFGSSRFQQNGGYSSRRTGWTHRQNTLQQGKITALDPVQPDGGFSWMAHVGRTGQKSFRLNSYPPSDVSMEADMGRQMEVELPGQKMQKQNVKTVASEKKQLPEMTLDRAVNLLTKDDEETLVKAANCIQHKCYQEDKARTMVHSLSGIEKLLRLLNHDIEEVQHAAAGALRNVVYQNNVNKMEVKDNDGVTLILQALQNSRDTDTRRQLTGILWNLSSHDLLKNDLSRESLSILTKSVLVPCSGIDEGENPKDDLLADDEVFNNATGCLRNLSSAGPDVRTAMRACDGLIDSLVYYVRRMVADDKADDKATENCICILHNLSYHLESEVPPHNTSTEPQQNWAPVFSCYPSRTAEAPKDQERPRPLLEHKANPRGVEWLWNPITIRMYLSLVARSERLYTQETVIGALQNITAGNGERSQAIAFNIIEQEKSLIHIQKIIDDGENSAKAAAINLLRNLSRFRELLPTIGDDVLPGVVMMLPNNETEQPGELTISVLRILINLCQSDGHYVKSILNLGAHPKIVKISFKHYGFGPTREARAACVLLHTMWKHGDLQGASKKKSDFINARTTKILKSRPGEPLSHT